MNVNNLKKCRCGGKPVSITTRHSYGAISCDNCGIHTKSEHCDNFNYGEEARKAWQKIMS